MKTGHLDGQRIAELQNYKFQMLPSPPDPLEALFYYDTTLHSFRYYNGNEWIDGTKYLAGYGINIANNTISINIASGANAGNVTLTATTNGLAANVANASTTAKGIIEIATDAEATTGTATDLAVTPKQLATKIGYTDLSIKPNSENYLDYDNTNGQISAKVDTTVTANSSKLITSGAVQTAIALALSGALIYQGTWSATNQTNYSTIPLPAKKGYMYAVSGTTTIDGVEWNSGDYLVINKDIAASGAITSADVDKIDNTEASDIVRLNATQTLTNKTINADNNTISNLEISNFKSHVVRNSTQGIRSAENASDSALVTEKNIATVLANKVYTTTNPALTQAGGICSWVINHGLNNANVGVFLYEVSTNARVMYDYSITDANTITVSILSATNIDEDSYEVVILG
jgi:hypothetical protein